jgi:amino acid transporter
MNDKPTRRDLLRPLHLLAIAFGCAAFAGIVTAVTTGAIQGKDVGPLALIVAGITFIVVLLGLAMLMLAVDPEQMQKPMDRPVLMKDEDEPDDDEPRRKS